MGFAGLVAVTGLAAVALVSPGIDIGQDIWNDAQSDPQRVASWQGSALLAYTAGCGIGQVCALLAGLLVPRYTPLADLRTALLVGAGLGLLHLALASWIATPRLRELAESPALRSPDGAVVIDTGLQHHGYILAAMAITFVLFLNAAATGCFLGRTKQLQPKIVTVAVAVVLLPVLPYAIAMGNPWPT